jgi:predicted  nucleic acid-binding Zn-ribbon protein
MSDSDYIKQLEATIEELQGKLAVKEVECDDLHNQLASTEEDVRYYRDEARRSEARGADDSHWNDP